MKLAPYLVCDGLCLAAYLGMAQAACRDRLWLPMVYAFICGFACAAASVGVVAPEFRAGFGRYFIPGTLAMALLYALAEVQRWSAAPAEEHLMAAALLCGYGISFVVGLMEGGNYTRLGGQTAAVVLPIAIAIMSIGPKPLPEPINISPSMEAPMLAAPVPPEGVTI